MSLWSIPVDYIQKIWEWKLCGNLHLELPIAAIFIYVRPEWDGVERCLPTYQPVRGEVGCATNEGKQAEDVELLDDAMEVLSNDF
jgi:hypothetical protein